VLSPARNSAQSLSFRTNILVERLDAILPSKGKD